VPLVSIIFGQRHFQYLLDKSEFCVLIRPGIHRMLFGEFPFGIGVGLRSIRMLDEAVTKAKSWLPIPRSGARPGRACAWSDDL